MTRPRTASMILLVPEPRPARPARASGAVRRYRIARLRFDSRPAGVESRFEYLKRAYD